MSKEIAVIIIIALVLFIVGGTAWWIDTLRFEVKRMKMDIDYLLRVTQRLDMESKKKK